MKANWISVIFCVATILMCFQKLLHILNVLHGDHEILLSYLFILLDLAKPWGRFLTTRNDDFRTSAWLQHRKRGKISLGEKKVLQKNLWFFKSSKWKIIIYSTFKNEKEFNFWTWRMEDNQRNIILLNQMNALSKCIFFWWSLLIFHFYSDNWISIRLH